MPGNRITNRFHNDLNNIVDYAKQYFGFDYEHMPVNDLDSMIFSQVVYYNYHGTPFEHDDFEMTLAEFVELRKENLCEWEIPLAEDDKLARLLEMGGRHGNVKGCRFVVSKDKEAAKQFGALTFELKKGLYYLAFSGTDNSVAGWKEDLNLSYQDVIPAQKDALEYAISVMDQFQGDFYFGGHSKGGNLAIYAAMNLPEEYQTRLLAVYNHDGPGFAKAVYETEKYKKIRPLIHKTIPESSVVGMLWEEDDHYRVVSTKAMGLFQHGIYTWLVEDDHLIEIPEIDRFAQYMKKTVERWINELDAEERKRFIDAVFDALYNTEVDRFQDLSIERFKKMKLLIEGVTEMPGEEKKHVLQACMLLLKISVEEMKEEKDTRKKPRKLIRRRRLGKRKDSEEIPEEENPDHDEE